MKTHTLTSWIIAALVAGVGLSLPTESYSQTKQRFYERKEEGWFWYHKEPEPEEIEEIELPPLPEPVVSIVESEPEQEEKPSGPKIYSSAWLQKALPEYRMLAIDDPTVENVKTYLYLQRLAIDRADRYATATEMATVGDPFLDETMRRPLAGFAVGSVDAASGLAKNNLVREIAQRAGLFFFFSSECTLCELQAPLIKTLVEHEGFGLVPISVDGKNLHENAFKTFQINNGHAEMLNVQTLPALFLATPDGNFAPIGQGVFSLPEIQQRILITAKRENLISEDEYNKTRPITNHNNLADLIPIHSEESTYSLQGYANEEGIVPPEVLLEHLTQSMPRGY